jgi:hypothetical protein
MFIISDRVRETSSTTGTGSVVLNGAYGAFQTFNTGIGNGNTTYYTIENTTQWEVGQGVYDSSTNSLSRDIVFDSSTGGGKIDLDGVSIVFCTLPAGRTFVEDPDGNVFVSGVHATSGTFDQVYTQDLNLSNDLVVSGDTYLNTLSATGDSLVYNIASTGEVTSSGFLTLIRPNSAGNFFHAYKDDSINQTVSLHVNSNTSPLWRLGLKTNPSSQTDPPTFAYVYGSDGSVGVLSNVQNYFALADALGFFITHDNHVILRASSQTGVYIDANNASYPAFTISGPVLAVEDLQRWEDSAGNVLSVVDSGGKFGILKETPEYELDVEGSGRFETAFYTSGIYFQDGSFQNTAVLGSVEQIEAVSGIAVYASGLAEQNQADILTVSGLLGGTFDNDLLVSLGGGKTFGRYENGDTIPASGLSPIDVITLAVTEPIDPSVSLSASPSTIETGTTAISNTLSFNYTINNPGATVASVSLEFRRGNTGAWTVLSTNTALTSYVHSFVNASADQINYRYVVTDSQGSSATATRNVSFSYKVFYGPVSSAPVTSADVRSLPTSRFSSAGNTFNLNTGSTEVNFSVAMPSTESITQVIDLDALNANITAEYVNNPFNVDDAGGTPVSYNVYTMTIASPYSSDHRHQVTKG